MGNKTRYGYAWAPTAAPKAKQAIGESSCLGTLVGHIGTVSVYEAYPGYHCYCSAEPVNGHKVFGTLFEALAHAAAEWERSKK